MSFQPPEKTILPLGLGTGNLIEFLSNKLVEYLPQPDVQVLLDALREELYKGLDVGPISDLHMVTKLCKKCPALQGEPRIPPPWNLVDPDCMIVLDIPPQSKELIALVVDSLAAAKFSSKRVFLTYLNRCRPSAGNKVTPQEISNCLGYLQTEIQILKPKLIIPMGVTAASALLGAPIKLGEDHGKIFWLGPWAIMPVSSPAYILKAGEIQQSILNQDLEYAHKFCYGDTR